MSDNNLDPSLINGLGALGLVLLSIGAGLGAGAKWLIGLMKPERKEMAFTDKVRVDLAEVLAADRAAMKMLMDQRDERISKHIDRLYSRVDQMDKRQQRIDVDVAVIHSRLGDPR